MGLISRVSSRTYRRNQSLNTAKMTRSTQNSAKSSPEKSDMEETESNKEEGPETPVKSETKAKKLKKEKGKKKVKAAEEHIHTIMEDEAVKFFNTDPTGPRMSTYVSQSIHPELIESKLEVVLGIDEAGRGPVLGPMVYACCFAPLSKHDAIRDQGCEDSKQLKDKDRRNIINKIHAMTSEASGGLTLGWIYKTLTPTFISTSQLAPRLYNLNEMSHDAASSLIKRAIHAGVNVKQVFVDTVGPPDKYRAKLEQRFPGINFIVESKADDIYPCVSAASIVAKVCRDVLVENWKHVEPHVSNDNCGSGYPGDKVSIAWMNKYFDPVFGFPQFTRFKWSTSTKIIDAKGHSLQFDSDDETDTVPSEDNSKKRKKSTQLQLFQPKRAAVFRNAKLQRITEPIF